MAARLNTRFILIIFIVLATLGLALGGVWTLKKRTDATRHIVRGDEFMAQEQYRTARKFYERAVGKEPTNLEFLGHVERALLSITPDTEDEAAELYRAKISLRKHAATHHPLDPSKHRALIDELYNVSRRMNYKPYIKLLEEAANDMWYALPPGVPERSEGKLYRGLARFEPLMFDRMTDEEMDAGELDLREYLEDNPASDKAWAALVLGNLERGQRARQAGQPTRAEELYLRAKQDLAEGRRLVPDGPLVIIAGLTMTLSNRARGEGPGDEAALREATQKLDRLVRERDETWLIGQASRAFDIFQATDGVPDAISILDDAIARQPDAVDLYLLKASTLMRQGELDEAEAAAAAAMNAPAHTVGVTSHIQHQIRKRAASLKVDIAARRWDTADPADRGPLEEAVAAARDELMNHVTDPENDPLLLRANGKVAFTSGDQAQAAALFNRLVTENVEVDLETLMYAAISLERQGELGAALERLDLALAQQPDNVSLLLHQAGLRMRVGHFVRASELVDQVLKLRPEDETALGMQAAIAKRLAPDGGNVDDPVRVAIREAENYFRAGEHESARSTLVAALEQSPDDLLILNALIRVEMAENNLEEARRYLNRGLTLVPRSAAFLQWKSFLDNPDPISRIKQYIAEVFTDEVDRSVETLLSMRELSDSKRAEATRLEAAGLTEEAAAARALADSAAAEIGPYYAKSRELNDAHPRFIEYRFLDAISRRAWEEALTVVGDASRLNSDQASGALYEGRLAAAQDDAAGAVRAFTRATEMIPYSAMAWRLLGVSQQQVGNTTEAVRSLERAYSNNPNDVRTVRRYAALLDLVGNRRRALLVVKDGRRLAPSDPALREQWLGLEAAVGDPAVALRERRRIHKDWQERIRLAPPADKKAMQQNEDGWRNAAALVSVLATTDPVRELILTEDGSVRFTNDRWTRMRAAEQRTTIAQAKTAWLSEANEIVNTLATGDDRGLKWHALRADLLRAEGKPLEGEALLRGYADRATEDSDHLNALLALGLYESQLNRENEAIAAFTEARKYQRDEAPRADHALGEYYFSKGRYEEALPHLDAVLEVAPGDRLRLQIVESLINLKRYDDARARLDAIEESSGQSTSSLLLRASVIKGEGETLFAAGDADEASRRFAEYDRLLEQVKRLDPLSPLPYTLQATILLQSAQRTRDPQLLTVALAELGRADELDASFPKTFQVRSAILQMQGDLKGAINELARLVELTPGDDVARTLLVRLLARDNRLDDALVAAEEAVQLKPSSGVWLEAVGDIYTMKLREVDARREALDQMPDDVRTRRERQRLTEEMKDLETRIAANQTKALTFSPSLPLLVKRGEALLTTEPPQPAAAVEHVEQYSDKLPESPLLRTVYARALDQVGRKADAVEQLRLSYAMYKRFIVEQGRSDGIITNWYDALRKIYGDGREAEAEALAMELAESRPNAWEYRALGTLWRESGRDGISRAIELYERGIEVCPTSENAFRVRLYSDLGLCLLMTDQYQRAQTVFNQVLEIDPDHAEALNNLAYLLAETMGDPARALPYAERAAALMPNSWSVTDTIGWIHFRLGQYDEAESYLRRSSQQLETAENQIHLAELYLKQSDLTRAERYLDKARELRPDTDTQREIDRLADDIRTGRGRGE